MKDFCGIIKVDDDEYACFVSGNIARIIPEGSNARERNDIFARIEKTILKLVKNFKRL